MAENEIIPVNPGELAGVDMFDLNKNLEGVEPKLPVIKILHGGANLFEMPTGEKVESFPCIILDQFRTNAWWKEAYGETGGGAPPDCFSMDGLTPDPSSEDVQSTRCKAGNGEPGCPMNEFGSAGRGKACKNMKRVHVLINNSSYPHRIIIPPTSLAAFDSYISALTDKGAPFQLVYTEFGLKAVTNKDGIGYAEMTFKAISGIDDHETARNIKAQMDRWNEAMRGEPIIRDDFGA